MLNRSELPEEGDKIVCLKNYWETYSFNYNALVNGTIGYLQFPTILDININFPRYLRLTTSSMLAMSANIRTDDNDEFGSILIDQQRLITGEPTLEWRDIYALNKNKYKTGDLIPKEFDYGYAITCHKAQGSQWSNVFILEENFPFQREEHARWLYTAITRAEEKAIIVRN